MNVDAACFARRTVLEDLEDVVEERQLIFSTDWHERFKPNPDRSKDEKPDFAPNVAKQEYLEELRDEIREEHPELLPGEIEAQVGVILNMRLADLVSTEADLRRILSDFDVGRPRKMYFYCVLDAEGIKADIDEEQEEGRAPHADDLKRHERKSRHAQDLNAWHKGWNAIERYLSRELNKVEKELRSRMKSARDLKRRRDDIEEIAQAFFHGDFWSTYAFLEKDYAALEKEKSKYSEKKYHSRRAVLERVRRVTMSFQELILALAIEAEPIPTDEAQL